jgi:uncharacterized protein with PQ loop repeat
MNEFHKPFIKSLVTIAAVALVSWYFSGYFVQKFYFHYYKTPSFTSSEFPKSHNITSEAAYNE